MICIRCQTTGYWLQPEDLRPDFWMCNDCTLVFTSLKLQWCEKKPMFENTFTIDWSGGRVR